jgi:hypothetical protein
MDGSHYGCGCPAADPLSFLLWSRRVAHVPRVYLLRKSISEDVLLSRRSTDERRSKATFSVAIEPGHSLFTFSSVTNA